MTVAEMATVETIKPGDRVTVGRAGSYVVAEVNEYEDGTYVVVYFKQGAESYENKARDSSGRNQQSITVLQSIIPLRKGATLLVERGTPAYAAKLRREMEEAETARARQYAERTARARLAEEEREAAKPRHVDPPRDPEQKPRSYICLCGHRILDDHALVRESTAPGTPYHYRGCRVDGCTCPEAIAETEGEPRR